MAVKARRNPPVLGAISMKFGLLYEGQRPYQGNDVDWNSLYKETLDQCELADQVGFDNLWFVEHHFPDGFFRVLPVQRCCLAP